MTVSNDLKSDLRMNQESPAFRHGECQTDLKSVIAEMWSIQEVVKQEIAKAVVERSDLK